MKRRPTTAIVAVTCFAMTLGCGKRESSVPAAVGTVLPSDDQAASPVAVLPTDDKGLPERLPGVGQDQLAGIHGLLQDAFAVAKSMKGEDEEVEKPALVAEVARAQRRAGDLSGLRELAAYVEKSMRDESPRHYFGIAATLAAAEAEHGNFDVATEIADRIGLDYLKCRAFVDIADAQQKRGDTAACLKTLATVEKLSDSASFREQCLEALIDGYASTGNYDQARAAARRLEESGRGRDGYLRIALAQAESGLGDEALAAFEDAGGSSDGVLFAMVRNFNAHQQLDAAVAALDQFDIPGFKAQAIGAVAAALIRAGQADRGCEVLRRFAAAYKSIGSTQNILRSDAAAEAVCATASLKGIGDAQAMAALMAAFLERGYGSKLYSRLGEFLAGKGDAKGADNFFRLALADLGEMPEQYTDERAILYRELAATAAKSRGPATVREWIERSAQKKVRAYALIGAADGAVEHAKKE